MLVRKIDKNIGTVPAWGEDNFDANVHENFSSLKEIVPQVNNSIDDMNVVIEDLNSKIGTVDNSVVVTSQAKTDAVAAAEAAILAKNEAQSLYDNFDDRYLGPFLTPPTLDNDGQPLKNGALYYLYTENSEDKGNMNIYDLQRAEWIDISYIPTLLSSLSDVVFGSKSNNDVIQYDSVTGKWVNRSFYSKAELDLFINIHTKTAMTTLNDEDEITTADSTTGWSLKKISWANLKANLKTYFDTLYAKVSGYPAFSAYKSSQSFTGSVWTKLACNLENYDATNAYDNVTNFRFTPQKAGKYRVSIHMQSASANTGGAIAVYKNSSIHTKLTGISGTTIGDTFSGACTIALNGTTDYVEAYGVWNSNNIAAATFQAEYISGV